MKASQLLQFVHDRLVYVYDENKNVGFLHSFRDIIAEAKAHEEGDTMSQWGDQQDKDNAARDARFRGTQVALPTEGTDFESVEESIKIERNSKGYNWSFRLKRLPEEGFQTWVDRCAQLDHHLRREFGN
jgi:hypothetical protein